MKLKLFTFSLLLLIGINLFAQREPNKIGYIDMDYILDNISDYKEANAELDRKIEKWRGEIELEQQKIKSLKEDLENERPLLTQDLIDERQDEIDYYRKKLQDYQQERFGPEGDMVAQRRQIMQPIQDEVFNVVQEIGDKREYDFIFDSSADALMLFSASRHDISDQILASIRRSSRKVTGDQKEGEEKNKSEDYKSVRQARLDKEETEKRESEKQAKLDERQALLEARQNERDSIRAARQAEFEARREQAKKDREERLNKRRNQQNNNTSQKEASSTSEKDTTSKTDATKENSQKVTEQQDAAADMKKKREEERQKQIEARQQERDSIQKARQKMIEKRQKERDSINQARKLERENRNQKR